MGNTKIWVVLSRRIGLRFSAYFSENVHPSALSYYLKKGTVAILSYVRKVFSRPRGSAGRDRAMKTTELV
jgi:hypothetical protein